MADSHATPNSLPIHAVREIDRACDDFEAALLRGEPPALGELLARVEQPWRVEMLGELVDLALEHLTKRLFGDALAIRLGSVDRLRAEIKEAVHGRSEEESTQPSQELLITRIVSAYLSADGDSGYQRTSAQSNGAAYSAPKTERARDVTISFDTGSVAAQPSSDSADPARVETAAGERFRKLKLHAAGGLGEVIIARDEQLQRDVALKQLQNQFADEQSKRQRFVLEAEVTGALEHPGIVPVYSLGADRNGRPFYAMRFIRGESFRKAAKNLHEDVATPLVGRRQLPFRRLIEALIRVCQAMEYAHRRGVLHRDLKPDNIMLGRHGEVYVVDWGMARIMGAPDEAPVSKSEALSEVLVDAKNLSGSSDEQTGMALGTPAYMSPEQAAGEVRTLTPASDVYSLGATLYYLLCGKSPFDSHAEDMITILRRVRAGDFAPPQQVSADLPRELNAVCLRAMALQPADRYTSASAFAGELQSWLDDEPVTAAAPTRVEQVGRWFRKHRSLAVVLGGSLAAVATLSTLSAVVIERYRQQAVILADDNQRLYTSEKSARHEADRRFLESRQTVDTWLTSYTEALRYYPDAQPLRTQMLEKAVEQYQAFLKERPDDPSLQLEQSRTSLRLAVLYRSLRQPELAAASATAAIEVLAGVSGDLADEAQLDRIRAMGILAATEGERGELAKADQKFEAAIKELDSFAETTAEPTLARQLHASLLLNRASFVERTDQYLAARGLFESAATKLQQLAVQTGENLTYRVDWATALQGLGRIECRAGDATAAIVKLKQATTLFRAAAELKPEDLSLPDRQAKALLDLAIAHSQLGESAKEATAYRESLTILNMLVQKQPNFLNFQFQRALTLNDLGQLLTQSGELVEAERTLKSAVESLQTLTAAFPAAPDLAEAFAAASANLAHLSLIRGEAQAAIKLGAQAREQLERLAAALPEESSLKVRLAAVLSQLAQAHDDLDEVAQATAFHKQAHQTAEAAFKSAPDSLAAQLTAAQVALRQAEFLGERKLTSDAALLQQTLKQWNALKLENADPKFQLAAAWELAVCSASPPAQLKRAKQLADSVTQRCPANASAKAVAALLAARLAAPTKFSFESDAIASLDDAKQLFVSILVNRTERPEEAKAQLQQAEAWRRKTAPGDRELAALETLVREAIPKPAPE